MLKKKIDDHNHDKYIATSKFNKLTVETFNLRLKQKSWVSKIDISNFVKQIDFVNKLKDFTSNKNELNKMLKQDQC